MQEPSWACSVREEASPIYIDTLRIAKGWRHGPNGLFFESYSRLPMDQLSSSPRHYRHTTS